LLIPSTTNPQELRRFEISNYVIGLYNRKKNAVQIFQTLSSDYEELTLSDVISVIKEHIKNTTDFVVDNPDLLENKLHLIVQYSESLDYLLHELWLNYENTPREFTKIRNDFLKSIKDTTMEKAKVQQILDLDKDRDKRIKELEDANQRLILLFREVTMDCTHCKSEFNKILQKVKMVNV
jgi:hypothetical protein